MTTESSLGEGFDDAVRAVFRPRPNPSPSGKLRVANLFCGTGSLSQTAQEAGMEIVYAHETNRRARTTYTKKIGLEPATGELPNFSTIPAFDVVLASLPKDDVEGALGFVLRFLRVRRPDTFVLVGPPDADEQALATLVREKTQTLGYQVASGGDALLGVYEPRAKDVPVAVGLLYLNPTSIPVLGSDEAEMNSDSTMVRVILEHIVLAFG